MKKVIISILLVLPFLLIYFISFTGQILSRYNYLPVERIALLDDNGDELESTTIKVKKDEIFNLRVKVYPELASNKKYSITNSNKSICEVNETDNTVKALEFGEATIIITSNDKHYIQYVMKFIVTQEELEDIIIFEGLTPENRLVIPAGRTKTVAVEIVPNTTLPEFRDLEWHSSDESIATVHKHNGTITAIKEGLVEITVKPVKKPELAKTIYIKVSSSEELGKGVWFAGEGVQTGKINNVPINSIIDLKSITKIVDLPELSIDDIAYVILTNYSEDELDDSMLNEGKIKILKAGVWIKVRIKAVLNGVDYGKDSVISFRGVSA